MQCFEEVDYEKAVGPLVVATSDLAMSELPPATELIKFSKPFETCFPFGLIGGAIATSSIVSESQVEWSLLVGIMSRYTVCLAGEFALYVLSRASAFVGRIRGRSGNEGAYSAGVLVFFRFGLRQQPGKGLVWSISVISFSVLTVFQFGLGACRDGRFGFTCHNDRMCSNGKGVLVPLAIKVRDRVDEIWFCWFFEGSLFDPFRSVIAEARSTEVNWMGLALIWILGFHIGGKLDRYSICLKVV